MSIGDLSALVGIMAIAGGASFGSFRVLRRFERKFGEFQQDWNGTAERPGVPRRAGVMERLELIELSQVDNRAQISEINQRLVRRGL